MASIVASVGGERTNRWLLIGAALFAVLAGAFIFALLANVGGGDGDGGRSGTGDGETPVLVAKETIGVGTDVTADMFELASFDGQYIVPDHVDDAAPLIGRQAKAEILAGQQISSRQFIGGDGAGDVPGSGTNVPPGMRAYSMSISEDTAVGGLLVPGDRVDVIVRYSTKTTRDAPSKQVHVELFAGNVLVLARGQERVEELAPIGSGDNVTDEDGEPTDPAAALAPDDIEPDPAAATLTLALTPEQVLRINQYEVLDDGEISVALRRFGDDTAFPAEGFVFDVFE